MCLKKILDILQTKNIFGNSPDVETYYLPTGDDILKVSVTWTGKQMQGYYTQSFNGELKSTITELYTDGGTTEFYIIRGNGEDTGNLLYLKTIDAEIQDVTITHADDETEYIAIYGANAQSYIESHDNFYGTPITMQYFVQSGNNIVLKTYSSTEEWCTLFTQNILPDSVVIMSGTIYAFNANYVQKVYAKSPNCKDAGLNAVNEIDVHELPLLRYLWCGEDLEPDYQLLSEIDLTHNSALENIMIAQCAMADLDVSNHTSLFGLSVENPSLKTLNIFGCTGLQQEWFKIQDSVNINRLYAIARNQQIAEKLVMYIEYHPGDDKKVYVKASDNYANYMQFAAEMGGWQCEMVS